jgi:hypothetical protein
MGPKTETDAIYSTQLCDSLITLATRYCGAFEKSTTTCSCLPVLLPIGGTWVFLKNAAGF